MQGKRQRTQKLFLSFQLADRVPEDNFYRRLTHSLDLNFLYKETKQYYGDQGQQSIDPIVFFKLILMGYIENLNSDRKIIDHARLRLDILYFIGYDIDEELPWHSTLSRTRQLYGEEVFRLLFKKVLSMCVEKGMVSGKRQAVDSVFVKANASMDSLIEKQVLEDADAYSDELKDNADEGRTVSASAKKKIERQHNWQVKAYKGKPCNLISSRYNEHGVLIRPKFLSNQTHYSPTDPDARISVKTGKPRQLNYTAQTVVDTKGHVITNIMADYSDKRDSQSLPRVIDQVRENLKENDLTIQEVLADAGYSSGTALKYLDSKGITGYIPSCGQYKNSRDGFTYDPQNDEYTCREGKKLVFKSIQTNDGKLTRIYRSRQQDCKDCTFKKECFGAGKMKQISDSVDKPYYDKMHHRLQTVKAQRMKKLRSSTVEPVLGTLVNFTGMKRVYARGIHSANKFVLGAAIAYNLKKWMNCRPRKVKVQTAAMNLPETQSINTINTVFNPIWTTIGYTQRIVIGEILTQN